MEDYSIFIDRLERQFDALCVDLSFVEEFLKRDDLFERSNREKSVRAAYWVLLTYSDSLYLNTAKLLERIQDSVSLQNFVDKYSTIGRFQSTELIGEYEEWVADFNEWSSRTESQTTSLIRSERIAHSLIKSWDRGGKRLPAYKDFKGNDKQEYIGTVSTVVANCRDGIFILARLLTLCGKGRNSPHYFGFKRAAEKNVEDALRDYREYQAALLSALDSE
ncbi:hypothetical protein [Pararhodobacter zhoushanensis]|uniref:hypothetical protein n=1 Tax=Pararhodobacter zhoushanensis TaxID=2479545 RepID=UPI0013E02376|nr:hypothetical protein [Pararhodobacter zhoushanensis]